MYIKRNESGQVVQVSHEATAECREFLPSGSSELQEFVSKGGDDVDNLALSKSDLAFVRVLEDVIELLMDKGVISFTELPEAPTAGNGASCKSCAHCPWMAMNALDNLADALRHGSGEILVDDALRQAALKPLERMLNFQR